MHIRTYHPNDLAQMAQLFYDTVHAVCAQDYAPQQLHAWADGKPDLALWQQRFQNSLTLVMEEKGALIGFADMEVSGHLDMLYVHKDHQRKGVAARLCDALEQANRVPRYTVEASVTARGFFEKRGYFVADKHIAVRNGVEIPNYIMEKKLQRTGMLYIHIPFCARKCAYCDFVSYAGCQDRMTAYVDALIREMDARPSEQVITSVFLGGGTPSLLPAQELERLLAAVQEKYRIAPRCEMTSECNPGTVTAEWLQTAVRGGINRLSMGVQTVQSELLQKIGRIHDFGQVEETFRMAREAGIMNISADLMYALPGQTLEMWTQSLEEMMKLQPQHLSCYALIVNEDTPFGALEAAGKLHRPDEDEEMQMQTVTAQVLAKHGLYQYEVSNYAKPGFACRHNVGYWTRRDYIGLGCAAHSLEGNVRRSNVCGLEEYISGAGFAEEEVLSPEDAAFEELMLGLRMVEGTNLTPFAGVLFADALQKQCAHGLMRRQEQRVNLTARGFDVMNTVLTELMP